MDRTFDNLRKIPNEPAARLLALANARLKTPLRAPASADVATVLAELDAAGAAADMLRLLSAALPPRERTWWACLAGRDVAAGAEPAPRTLATAEAWVFKPTDENRAAARAALDAADPDDELVFCAMAAVFADGTLGPGELAQHPAPPGAAQAAAFGMNLKAIGTGGGDFAAETGRLIDRALDIARGGNGRIAPKAETGA